MAPGVPAYLIRNTAVDGRYRIEKEILTDPWRDVVLQRVRFVPLQGRSRISASTSLLAPHLANRGSGNTAWVGDYKGTPMLLAERENYALALASLSAVARPIGRVRRLLGRLAGTAGGQAPERSTYSRAENGNVAVTGEIDLQCVGRRRSCSRSASVPPRWKPASTRSSACSRTSTERKPRTSAGGRPGTRSSEAAFLPRNATPLYHLSAAVLRTHESKRVEGGVIASLSIPWGFSKGDDDLGGYHLVWPRDLVETAGGFLAIGAHDAGQARAAVPAGDAGTRRPLVAEHVARRHAVLARHSDGRDGAADSAGRSRVRARRARRRRRGMRSGRWCGERPRFSRATVRSARRIAGRKIPAMHRSPSPQKSPRCWSPPIWPTRRTEHDRRPTYLRETADAWNASIERWLYVTGTELARAARRRRLLRPRSRSPIAPTPRRRVTASCRSRTGLRIESTGPAALMVSLDALAFVRFGLRAADDPRIVNTVKVIDATLRVDTPRGPAWHRYQGDGYGEHADGAPFDGTGIGRAWPLLTGERAHYELAAGRARQCRTAGAGARGFRRRQRSAAGADLGQRRYSRAGTVHRARVRLGDAARVGARRVPQAVPVASRREVFDRPPQTVQRYSTGQATSTRM